MYEGATDPIIYQLRGMVLYGLNHYIAVIRNEKTGTWYKYDDANSKRLSGNLGDIVVYCVKSYFKPTVVIYERPDSCELPK